MDVFVAALAEGSNAARVARATGTSADSIIRYGGGFATTVAEPDRATGFI